MKRLILLTFLTLHLVADDSNSTMNEISVEQNSTIIEADAAHDIDELKEELKRVDENTTSNPFVSPQEQGYTWKELTPEPEEFDWLQLSSNEWLKGEFRSMYEREFEFDSDEMGLLTFDAHKVLQIKTHNKKCLNIQNVATVCGYLWIKKDKILLVGENSGEFERSQVIAIAGAVDKESDYWSGKVTLGLNSSRGNTIQDDVTSTLLLQRRTADDRVIITARSNYTVVSENVSTNNHRLDVQYDRFLTRKLFWQPLVLGFYSDPIKNIALQSSYSVGMGYIFHKRKDLESRFSIGPGVTRIKYVSSINQGVVYSPLVAVSFLFDADISKISEFIFDAKASWLHEEAGGYTINAKIGLENEIFKDFDLDGMFYWDRIGSPQEALDGTIAKQDDYRFVLSLGYEF